MKLDHLVILLTDLKANIDFYDALLPLIGFEKTRDNVFVNREGIYLDFRQADEPNHEYRRYAPGLNHLGFTCENKAALIQVKEKLTEAGFHSPEIQVFPDGEAIFFKDKEGMRVELAYYVDSNEN
ncbi:glyoxalase [Aliikangiella marina]|uniref:Glyoxalase n=1 Tax=Aliikangiella marina TaxID=1712262 RepID=A0A545T595_9GAMM|nr:VOC family protein [Aliikangiella marina]TQV72338.1 glyoxalase [Aliikangiella marina]